MVGVCMLADFFQKYSRITSRVSSSVDPDQYVVNGYKKVMADLSFRKQFKDALMIIVCFELYPHIG